MAGLAAVILNMLTGNPDYVSSIFVAVLCISPTVLMGLRRAFAQFSGSALGGIWGTLMNYFAAPLWIGIPLAVGPAVLSSLLLGQRMGYQIAAFTALFVQIVPRGSPVDTMHVRMLAVSIGALSGLAVNILVSAALYRLIFERRLRIVEERIQELLAELPLEGSQVVKEGFEYLKMLQEELALALEELKWRRNWKMREQIARIQERTEELNLLLHLILDLGYMMEEKNVTLAQMHDFFVWLKNPAGEARKRRKNCCRRYAESFAR